MKLKSFRIFCQISMLMVCFDEKNRAFLRAPEIDLRAHRKSILRAWFFSSNHWDRGALIKHWETVVLQ